MCFMDKDVTAIMLSPATGTYRGRIHKVTPAEGQSDVEGVVRLWFHVAGVLCRKASKMRRCDENTYCP